MKRTKQSGTPDLILTGDWHLREDQPICRTDDFQAALWKKVDFISKLQQKYGCPVIHSGDLFHHWKPSPYLLSKAMKHLPARFYTVYGNHDLPQHSLDLVEKCGIHVLETANRIWVLENTHWGQSIDSHTLRIEDKTVAVAHTMTWEGSKPWPDCPDPSSHELLRRYPQFDLILTGHNHKTFVAQQDGRMLVNPGSISRQEADQIDHDPCVFLWYEKENRVEEMYLPKERFAITREHLDSIKERNDRIDAFVSRLDNEFSAEITFEGNLEKMIKSNQIRQSVIEIIYQATET